MSYLAGVDASDNYVDVNGTVHPIDGVNLWPVLVSGAKVDRTWLPTTPQSILHTDGQGHMWKLITLETQAVRFRENGTNYADPFNKCLSATTVFDCVDSLGENGGGGRQSCHVCTPQSPCLYDGTCVRSYRKFDGCNPANCERYSHPSHVCACAHVLSV